MASPGSSEEKTFRRFLELFLREFRGPFGEEDPIPLRPFSDHIIEEEVEGECLDLCLQQLCKYNCPFLLAAALARATADEIVQSDLSAHYLPKHVDNTDGIIQLESVKLARHIFSKLHELCCSWVKDYPLRKKMQPYYETSIHAIKNMRRKMEDKHICIPDFNTLFNLEDQEEQAYFAVFDGHGGVDAAVYASVHLHVNLVRQESFLLDPAQALCKAFHVTDERFVQKAARENLRCGTTGVVTFIRGNMLHVAWVGDSQAMMVRRGQAVELMKPHKPDREDEKQRIEALGGCVVWFGAWRVNGSLSVSRAIGDSEHKPYICGEADSASFELDGTEDYLILACDGFYDTVSPEEAVKVVSDHLTENSGDNSMVAHKLVASARDAGSSDNITVIVVFLRDMTTPVNASVESNWTENSFEGEQEDGGDDKENHGDCKGQRPQHQVSAPADLGYDNRMDSFTDRTSLSLGPRIQLFPEECYIDLMKGEKSQFWNARAPPLTMQRYHLTAPKKGGLTAGLSEKELPTKILSIHDGARKYRALNSICDPRSQIYNIEISPSSCLGSENAQCKSLKNSTSNSQRSLHFIRQRKEVGKWIIPKPQALLYALEPSHKPRAILPVLARSKVKTRMLVKHSMVRRKGSYQGLQKQNCLLNQNSCIPDPDLCACCQM